MVLALTGCITRKHQCGCGGDLTASAAFMSRAQAERACALAVRTQPQKCSTSSEAVRAPSDHEHNCCVDLSVDEGCRDHD